MDNPILKFIQDPEWHLIEEMLSKNTEPLKDISNIDITQSAETIKAIVAGRQETLKLINNFHSDIESAKRIITNKPTGFK